MTCNLCKKEKTLVKTPVYPEWLHTSLYQHKRWYAALSEKIKWTRDERPAVVCEELLCHECMQRLGEWEAYAHRVFSEGGESMTIRDADDHFVISGLRYAPFKLFQMSLIWRASISRGPEVHRINLGPHAERIREMLIEASPGEKLRYCAMLLFPFPSVQQIMFQPLDTPQRLPFRVYGHTAYQGVFGGLVWIFIVSSHSDDLPEDSFLSEDGTLPLGKFESPAVRYLERLEAALEEAQTLYEPP